MRFVHVTAALTATACAAAPRATLDLGKLPRAEQHPGVGAIVLLEEHKLDFAEEGGEPVVVETVHRRLRLLRDSGRDELAVVIHYDRGFDRVRDVFARVLRPNGEEQRYGRRDLEDRMVRGAGVLYADDRFLYKSFDDVPAGGVLEVEYSVRHSSPQLFLHQMGFADTNPIEDARFEVTAPPGWTLRRVALGVSGTFEWPPEESRTADGSLRWSWRKERIARVVPEPGGPRAADLVPRIGVWLGSWVAGGKSAVGQQTMTDFSRAFAKLQEGTAEPDVAVRRVVAEIIAGAPDDPRERARRLYEWVQKKVRYVAIELGIGGWRAHPASEVLEARYGDCKDKATLLAAMLAVAGIPSRPVALYAHGGYPRPIGVPVFGTTNHMILAVDLPGGTVFADPTTRWVPFGALPLADQEAELLPADLSGAPPVTAPASRAEDNQEHLRLALQVDESGAATGTYLLEVTGAFEDELRDDLAQPRKRKRKEAIEAWISLEQATVAGDALTEGPKLALSGSFTVRRVLDGSGPVRMVRLSSLLRSMARSMRRGERSVPVVHALRSSRVVELRIALPPKAQVGALPAPVTVSGKLGSYTLGWSREGPELAAVVRFDLSERVVAPPDYAALVDFYDRVLAAEAAGVMVRFP